MAPGTSTPSLAKSKAPPKTEPANGRVTRLRSQAESSTPTLTHKPSGILARGKAELRKVSEKMKENKERERAQAQAPVRSPIVDGQSSESLKAYLRIRPPPMDSDGAGFAKPYLEVQNDQEVLMRPPIDAARSIIPKASLVYSFDRVYQPSTSQSAFFSATTLPLVDKLLHGENGLLFAYGVTNSGKSYTISGGNGDRAEERGLLPRAVDVVFNSIQGAESDMNLRCTGLADVEIVDDDLPLSPSPSGSGGARSNTTTEEFVNIDKNYSYAVFVSYAEVYNDKIFDLLENASPLGDSTRSQAQLPRGSSMYPLNSSMNLAAIANGGNGVIKRKMLQLKQDPDGNGKYIAGLNEIRARSREEALAVFHAGQSARQVFGTMANRESSRSHGIFTIKVVRIHNGAPDDPESIQVSRLAIVDLAGSERNKNTQTTGERLKEAGNINRSLMVLGQCLEVLRSNQAKLNSNVAPGTRKKLDVVPFRHSKLTEIFQNFFVGEGRAVMIVNVNPYDTGFDENSHVMRFSAVAREVQTTAANKVHFPTLKRQISTQLSAFRQTFSGHNRIKVVVPVLPKVAEGIRETKMSSGRVTEDFVMVEEEIEVVEEDEEDEEDDDDGRDMLVESLFEQLRDLKTRLYESEMRSASIEVEIREEVAKEMQDTLARMTHDFQKRLQEQVQASEEKTDRKIDIVSRMATPAAARFGSAISPIDADTPLSAADTSMTDSAAGDETFASALDISHISQVSSEANVRQGRISDPFVVNDALPIPTVIITRQSGSLPDLADSAGVSPTPAAEESYRGEREDTAESEDPLSAPVVLGSESDALTEEEEVDGEDEGSESEEEDEEDEEDDAEGEDMEADAEVDPATHTLKSDEESYDDEADVENGADGSDSSFSMTESESSAAFSSPEESPVRRAWTRRRTSGSPKKPRSPTKPASAAKPTKTKAPVKSKTAREMIQALGSPASDESPRVIAPPAPLGERAGQDGDDEYSAAPTKTKRKRTLGKKVVLEDDMMSGNLAGAEVRRMMRGSGAF